jgi:serine/threonine-protein kinase
MGMVLAATHLALGTRVAIKVMLGGGKKSGEHEARFLREARVAAMLRSQHAGKVLDVGTTEAGAPYIVLEYLDGEDLGARLQARGPMPVEEAVGYVLQACEAIAEAHALGIVHRDIKPPNLFLTTGVDGAPCIKVVDFGVAKHGDGSLALTGTTQALGSPLYMSPEQMGAAREVDGRADIWSLGVTLFELLTNTTPFEADTLPALCTRVCSGAPTPITQLRGDVPAGLEAVLRQCFEKDRARRWPNLAALAAALAPYGDQRSRIYAERVAGVAKVEVPLSRPTDLLPPEPTPRAVAAAPVVAPPPAPPTAVATAMMAAMGPATGATAMTAAMGPAPGATAMTAAMGPATGAPAPAPRDKGGEARPFWSGQRIAGVAVGGAGLVGLVLGAAFGAKTLGKTSDAKAHCDAVKPYCDPTGLALQSDAASSAKVADAALIIGGAAVVGGVVLFLTSPAATSTAAGRMSIRPVAGLGRAGVSLEMEW